MNGIFDSHAHYDDEKFDDDRDSLLESILSSNVSNIINCASDIDSSYECINLSEKYNQIYAAVGVHPHSAEDDMQRLDEILPMLNHNKVVAVGEIGLDYHYDFSPRDKQKEIFRKQLEIANSNNFPVVIHTREATEDTLKILKEYKPKGVVHCFSGSVETAKEILKLDMYFGFGGAVTFKNAVKPVESVKYIPMDRILLETDCPYMAPVPHRGKRNDSSYITYVAEKIAEIKDLSPQEVIDIAFKNTKKLFNIN